MERVIDLEKEHVRVHSELLRSLDELYLLKQNCKPFEDKEPTSILETRRQLQISLEKSAAIARALERLSKRNNKKDDVIANTEDLLASRLGRLMEKNYDLDHLVSDHLQREEIMAQDLRREQDIFNQLSNRLKIVSGGIKDRKKERTQGNDADNTSNAGYNEEEVDSDNEVRRSEIIKQNEVIEEVLIALKIHGGYDLVM